MRRSNFGSSSVQRQSVLKPRNTETPDRPSRLSSGLRKVRGSTDGNVRLSQTSGRYTPTRSNIPRYTPVRSHGPNSNVLMPPAPSSVNRLSVESTRNSSMGGKNRKDTRPIGDAAFKSECIDKVLDFLITKGYEYEIHRRNLLNPSTRDFTQMFTFIYRHFNPSYTLPHKFEEEIPRLMKLLRYPTQMLKSTFVSVGSRHTWPSVLAMLAWMIDTLNIYYVTDPLAPLFSTDFDDLECSLKNKRINKLFDIYKYGKDNDDIMKQQEEYHHVIEELYEVRVQDMISLEEHNDRLDEEMAIANSGPERLEQLQLQYEQLLSDKQKMECYKKDIQVLLTAKETEKSQLENKLGECNAEAAQLNDEQCKLEAIKAKQALNAGELARFKNHAKDVAVLISQLQAQGKEMDSQIWNLEITLGKSQKELSEKISSYNTLVQELELGEELKIENTNVAESMQQWRKELVPVLYAWKKKIKHYSYEIEVTKMRTDDQLSVVEENLKEKKSDYEKLENKLRRLEDNITMTKNEILAEEKEMQQEIERLHQQIVEARKGHKASLHQKQYSLDQAKVELEAAKAQAKDRMQKGAEFLIKVCNVALEDLEFKTTVSRQFKKDVSSTCKELLQNIRNRKQQE